MEERAGQGRRGGGPRGEAANAAAAKAGVDADALPALRGTAKQVAWATQIRATFAAKHPTDKRLKSATTAKYWIDNRNAL
ncbi:hypothetical protein [Azospirillum argentinense]|uniref:hypothetical protein n=1 Tax=Azospirillum argentinense TaxID=2970906 RepID=UPI0015865E82|nr:hypothetical protein [Azospirillum argentinense]